MKTEMVTECGFGQLLNKPTEGVVLVLAREDVDGLGLAFEIARRAVETRDAARLRIWSWQSFLSLDGVMLTGDSYTPGHRWTLTRDMLLESDAKDKPAWMQDLLMEGEREVSLHLNSSCVNVGNGTIYLGNPSDVTILDFRGELDFRQDGDIWKLRRLNEAAKTDGQVIIMVVDLSKSLGKNYYEKSYAALAMHLCVEFGIDLPSCAEAVVQFERTTRIGPPIEWCRIMHKDDEPGRKSAFVVEQDEVTGRYRENYNEDEEVSEY